MCATNNSILRIQVPVISGAFAHIAAGGNWITTITLINTSNVQTTVSIALSHDDGSALVLPVMTTSMGTSQTTNTAVVSTTLSPNATLQLAIGNGVSALNTGWAKVLSSGPLGGYANLPSE
ncbi:MAG: hypothetical protein WDO73_00350 [Ignavibacteriota bacterium]